MAHTISTATLYMADSTASTRSEIRAEIVVFRAGGGSDRPADAIKPGTTGITPPPTSSMFLAACRFHLLADDEIQLLMSEMVDTAATFSSGGNNSKIGSMREYPAGADFPPAQQLSGGLYRCQGALSPGPPGWPLPNTAWVHSWRWHVVDAKLSRIPSARPSHPDNLLHIERVELCRIEALMRLQS